MFSITYSCDVQEYDFKKLSNFLNFISTIHQETDSFENHSFQFELKNYQWGENITPDSRCETYGCPYLPDKFDHTISLLVRGINQNQTIEFLTLMKSFCDFVGYDLQLKRD